MGLHKIKKEVKIYLETKEDDTTTTQNLWDIGLTVPRGKFIVLQTYLKKQTKKRKSSSKQSDFMFKGT